MGPTEILASGWMQQQVARWRSEYDHVIVASLCGGFAAVPLAIAIVGVAGVLAFSVSTHTPEFGIAIGSQPRRLLAGVIAEDAMMPSAGVVAGAMAGIALARLAATTMSACRLAAGDASACVLLAGAVIAWALSAARVDVIQALRTE